MIYQKTFRTDCISKHTKINRGERTKYLVSNNHPAIVDRDLFNAVQAELARRSSKRRTSDKTLREQQETAKAKLDKSDEVNSEIKRLCDWLDSHDTSFTEYDDMVIRRVVECIKAYKDGTIKVITKFGTEITETV